MTIDKTILTRENIFKLVKRISDKKLKQVVLLTTLIESWKQHKTDIKTMREEIKSLCKSFSREYELYDRIGNKK